MIAIKSGLPSLGSTEGAVITADEVSVSEDGSAAASVGEDLPRGKSAYEIAKENGFDGTEAEWLASLKGATGAAGADGTDGVTPTFSVESVETGEPGTDADVVMTGDAPNFGLKFVIPRGNAGAKGDKGDTGATPNLTIGTVTTLEAGQDATASMGGTAANPVLNLGIPQGAKGEPGEGGSGSTESAVLYTKQSLTDEQKAQARNNISAAKDNGVIYLTSDVTSAKIVQTIMENPKSMIECVFLADSDRAVNQMIFLPYYQRYRGSGYTDYLGYAIGNYDVQNSKEMPFDVYCYKATSDMGSFSVGLTPMHENKSVLDSITGITSTVSSSSTDNEIPSAKCLYDLLGDVTAQIDAM